PEALDPHAGVRRGVTRKVRGAGHPPQVVDPVAGAGRPSCRDEVPYRVEPATRLVSAPLAPRSAPHPAAVASIARGSGLRGERADHRQCCDPRLHRTTSCWMPSEEAAPMVEEAAGVLLSRSLVESRYQNPAIGAGGHVAPPSHCPLTPQGRVECAH